MKLHEKRQKNRFLAYGSFILLIIIHDVSIRKVAPLEAMIVSSCLFNTCLYAYANFLKFSQYKKINDINVQPEII